MGYKVRDTGCSRMVAMGSAIVRDFQVCGPVEAHRRCRGTCCLQQATQFYNTLKRGFLKSAKPKGQLTRALNYHSREMFALVEENRHQNEARNEVSNHGKRTVGPLRR
jgi:hypothetical protein